MLQIISFLKKNVFEATYFQPNRNIREGLLAASNQFYLDFGRSHLIGVLADVRKFGIRWDFWAPCPVGAGREDEGPVGCNTSEVPRNSVHLKAVATIPIAVAH